MQKIYRNRAVINQRGASISIDNTTDQENIHISQRSGSNILINNLVNSEFASNNKQTLVTNDNFETVTGDNSFFTGGDKIDRIGGNSYNFKGFVSDSEINAFNLWKEKFRPIAENNSKFKIKRGGYSIPSGVSTEPEGERMDNPVIGTKIFTVENRFGGYTKTPLRLSNLDEVSSYTAIPSRGNVTPAQEKEINDTLISRSAGESGSNAPGVKEFGAEKSAATEGGEWKVDEDATTIAQQLKDVQKELIDIERQMGDGGDEQLITKRNKMETVGVIFNDYPSVRIDEKGRSQPFEMLVSDAGIYKNHDYVPHVEEVDNSSNFPCGQDHKVVGNSYNRVVGSGGISLKTTGSFEMGGSTLKTGFKKININASHGVHIGSESGVEIQSLKTITLRTNRQVFVESSLGVKNNLIVGGGLAVEGESYFQHITGPLEVHQTEDTLVSGQFATTEDRKLFIGECDVGGVFYPVYAKATPDLLAMYPHSHNFNNIAMTLTRSNADTRRAAMLNNINNHVGVTQAIPQLHQKKLAVEINP